LASYERRRQIDWSKTRCSTNIKLSYKNAQSQQMLKKINVNIELEPMLVIQHRNEVS
jgi:hypothetical protein